MRALAKLAALVVLAPLALGQARADSTPYLTLGPQVSTLGLGGEAGLRINNFLGARIGGNYFSTDTSRSFDGIDYDLDLGLASAGGVVDVHPFGGGLRLSGGLRWNGNAVDLRATPNGSITVGGTTFSGAQAGTLQGKLDFNTFAPYLGFGYQGSLFSDFLLLALDLGVLYQGDPKVRLSSTGTLANDPAFRNALDRQERDIEDDLRFLRFYPVVALTLTYRF